MRIVRDQFHRQIGDREDVQQSREGKRGQYTLHDRGGPGQVRDGGLAGARILPHGQRAGDQLQRRKRSGKPQGGKAEFGDHCRPTVVSSAISAACPSLMPSNSRGM